MSINTSTQKEELKNFNFEDPIAVGYMKILDSRSALKLKLERSCGEINVTKSSLERIFRLSFNQNLHEMISYLTFIRLLKKKPIKLSKKLKNFRENSKNPNLDQADKVLRIENTSSNDTINYIKENDSKFNYKNSNINGDTQILPPSNVEKLENSVIIQKDQTEKFDEDSKNYVTTAHYTTTEKEIRNTNDLIGTLDNHNEEFTNNHTIESTNNQKLEETTLLSLNNYENNFNRIVLDTPKGETLIEFCEVEQSKETEKGLIEPSINKSYIPLDERNEVKIKSHHDEGNTNNSLDIINDSDEINHAILEDIILLPEKQDENRKDISLDRSNIFQRDEDIKDEIVNLTTKADSVIIENKSEFDKEARQNFLDFASNIETKESKPVEVIDKDRFNSLKAVFEKKESKSKGDENRPKKLGMEKISTFETKEIDRTKFEEIKTSMINKNTEKNQNNESTIIDTKVNSEANFNETIEKFHKADENFEINPDEIMELEPKTNIISDQKNMLIEVSEIKHLPVNIEDSNNIKDMEKSDILYKRVERFENSTQNEEESNSVNRGFEEVPNSTENDMEFNKIKGEVVLTEHPVDIKEENNIVSEQAEPIQNTTEYLDKPKNIEKKVEVIKNLLENLDDMKKIKEDGIIEHLLENEDHSKNLNEEIKILQIQKKKVKEEVEIDKPLSDIAEESNEIKEDLILVEPLLKNVEDSKNKNEEVELIQNQTDYEPYSKNKKQEVEIIQKTKDNAQFSESIKKEVLEVLNPTEKVENSINIKEEIILVENPPEKLDESNEVDEGEKLFEKSRSNVEESNNYKEKVKKEKVELVQSLFEDEEINVKEQIELIGLPIEHLVHSKKGNENDLFVHISKNNLEKSNKIFEEIEKAQHIERHTEESNRIYQESKLEEHLKENVEKSNIEKVEETKESGSNKENSNQIEKVVETQNSNDNFSSNKLEPLENFKGIFSTNRDDTPKNTKENSDIQINTPIYVEEINQNHNSEEIKEPIHKSEEKVYKEPIEETNIKSHVEDYDSIKINIQDTHKTNNQPLIENLEYDYNISIHDGNNKNQLLESNYITINMDIPENKEFLDLDVVNTTSNIENIDVNNDGEDDKIDKYKKRKPNLSENYQDEITRYDYETSKLNQTEKSIDDKKNTITMMDKAYITNFSENPNNYKSYMELEFDGDNIKESRIEDDQSYSQIELKNEKSEINFQSEKIENNFDSEMIKYEESPRKKHNESSNKADNNYTDDVDDVVNYLTVKSPVIKNKRDPEFNFDTVNNEVLAENVNLTNIGSRSIEEDNLCMIRKSDVNLYSGYKTNLENDLLISLDQYKSELIENIVEEDKEEKIQQIQESAKRQYELLTKANSLETIHEVRSVIFNNDTEDEKISPKKTQEIVIKDEGEEKLDIEDLRANHKSRVMRNSLVIFSKASLRNSKEDKLNTTQTSLLDVSTTDKKFHKLLESKRSSVKIFNTKKWDIKPIDLKLKQIQAKITPLKIPPKPKLIPTSPRRERTGYYSPKSPTRTSMPNLKDLGNLDICFVCKGPVVKPKFCKKCNKCVCHVCSFNLEDKNKCPDCNCPLVHAIKSNKIITTASSSNTNIKKFSFTEKKPQTTTSIFGKIANKVSNLTLKNKFKTEISSSCCNCKDSTIASINCPKCGKSTCVMCLNNSNDPNKCLSCNGNFKTTAGHTRSNSQTIVRRFSLNTKRTNASSPNNYATAPTKTMKKMVLTSSTKTLTTICAICKKSALNKNKCNTCKKGICNLCYFNIEGDKSCNDCFAVSRNKLMTTKKYTAVDQKSYTSNSILRLKSRQLDVSNASKNLFTEDKVAEKCNICRKSRKTCSECLKTACSNCTKDTFENNRCFGCRKLKTSKAANIFTQKIVKEDTGSYIVYDDICLICKSQPEERINCNNCRKPICTKCVNMVKENDSKCPNCNNINYNALEYKDKTETKTFLNSPEEKILAPETPSKPIENDEIENKSIQIDGKCLVCSRDPYNQLSCNSCQNEVCFTCTYSMKDQYKCPKCEGILHLKENKENVNGDTIVYETPKVETENDISYHVLNQENSINAFKPIPATIQIEKIDPTENFILQNTSNEQIIEHKIQNEAVKSSCSLTSTLIDNCLICKGAPIKPKACGTCKKQVCKMCSYEIYDNKCPGCSSELNLIDLNQSEKVVLTSSGKKASTGASELNKEITNTKIEDNSHTSRCDLCLVCKGFPIKPKTCENCNKSVCTICSYELDDPSKCQDCKGSYKKSNMRNSLKYKQAVTTHEHSEKKQIPEPSVLSGPLCIVCKRPPFKPKICWTCMSAIFCTPCSLNFEDSNNCSNCQTIINKEKDKIMKEHNSKINLNSSGTKQDGLN